jgi:acetylornithine deacetylase/succinyl-diaminopimelate desuccinylase-like protein
MNMEVASMSTADAGTPLYARPAELLQRLIRFDTTNPPGNEAACIGYIRDVLAEAGISSTILARDPARPNLIARVAGRGDAPPLLLYGHVDVVTTGGQNWSHPPFSGDIADGAVWGRGALDMKDGIAMMLAALLRVVAEDTPLPGDVIFAALSDEENWGDYGASFLVEEHADLFRGVRYALGELGGFTTFVGGQRFYPIMVAEKQGVAITATVRGPGGHGSLPMRGGAAARLGQLLVRLDQHRLPPRVPTVTRLMIEQLASALPTHGGDLLRPLLDPAHTDAALDLLGAQGATFDPLLHNTVNATVVHGGEKANVIPSELTVQLDGRILPGSTPDDMLAELRQLAGDVAEFSAGRSDPIAAEPDMGLFDTLATILREADPVSTPIPLLLSGCTDGRYFSRLGIQTYGFLPMNLPADFPMLELIHAADERIPVSAVEFGAEAIFQALRRFQ